MSDVNVDTLVDAERATICEECGSGILDGKHIADYPCSSRAGDGGGATRVTSGPRHATSGHRVGCWRLRGSEWECNCDRIDPELAGDGDGGANMNPLDFGDEC